MSKAKKIKMGKSYRLRGTEKEPGALVDVLTTARTHELFVVVSCSKTSGRIFTHDKYGHCLQSKEVSVYDLIEVSPYEDFKIDEPVMVSNAESSAWSPRYFAGVGPDGRPMAFNGGNTSWTSNAHKISWDYCRRPTKEELKP